MDKTDLFCLPFAGGSKYSYRKFTEVGNAELNIIPIESPGRGERINELLLTDLTLIVEDAFDQVKNKLGQRYAIFGHSMGALVGYLLCRHISNEKLAKPLYLIVSGYHGPSVNNLLITKLHLLPKKLFFDEIKEFNGVPDEVITNAELQDFFDPILRADFEAFETYVYQKFKPLDIPILILIGSDDNVSFESAKLWQKETIRDIEIRQFSGKHFFIFNHVEQILNLISSRIAKIDLINSV